MIKKIIFIFFTLFLIFGCKNDLILVLDTYNPPYDVVAIPNDNGITMRFWSGILSTDFAGFNMYVNTTGSFSQPDDAMVNTGIGGLPTIQREYHSRTLFTIKIPDAFANGTLQYATVTSYGTNALATNGYIETKINKVYAVVPRPEGTVTVPDGNNINIDGGTTVGTINISASGKTITPNNGYTIQNLGIQSSFTDIVVITNSSPTYFDATLKDISVNSMYVLLNGNSLVKLHITSTNGTSTVIRWSHLANKSLFPNAVFPSL